MRADYIRVMARHPVLATAVLLQVLVAAPAAEQGPTPDFSGRWTLVPERSVIQGRDGPVTVSVLGSDFNIQKEGGTLLVRVAPDLTVKWRVNLDGSPALMARTGPDGKLVRTMVTATWEGESLVVHLAEEEISDGRSVRHQTRRRFTLNPDHTLTVEMPEGQGGVMIGSVYRWLAPMP
jgi:hypothetical protein